MEDAMVENSDDEQNEELDNSDNYDDDPMDGDPDNDNNENVDGAEEQNNEDGEAQDNNETSTRKPVKKKVVMNPRPKLDPIRLCGSKGIPILPEVFGNKKFKGKGHEKEDLDTVMSTLEHWGHRLFPVMTFDTLLAAIEKLGAKKAVQVCVKKIRMDMPVLDNDFVTQRDEDDDDQTAETRNNENEDSVNHVDAFEELLRSQSTSHNLDGSNHTSDSFSPVPKTTISDEMRERIERNKQLAIERRRTRLLLQQSVESVESQDNGDSLGKDSLVVEDESKRDADSFQSPPDGDTVIPDSDTNLTISDKLECNEPAANMKFPDTNISQDFETENIGKEPTGLLNEDELLEEMWGNST